MINKRRRKRKVENNYDNNKYVYNCTYTKRFNINHCAKYTGLLPMFILYVNKKNANVTKNISWEIFLKGSNVCFLSDFISVVFYSFCTTVATLTTHSPIFILLYVIILHPFNNVYQDVYLYIFQFFNIHFVKKSKE